MKSFIKSAFALSSLLLAVNGQDVPVKGGTGGQIFNFDCPSNAFITQLTGRSGKNIDQLIVTCSDGTKSLPFGGNGGSNFTLESNPTGYKVISAYTGAKVDALQYRSTKTGGDGGTGFTFTDPSGGDCPAVGVTGRSGSRIDAVGFRFANCKNVTLPTAEAATVTPTSGLNVTSFNGVDIAKPGQFVGGAFNELKTFSCDANAYITQIIGRAGKNIDQLQIMCSKGTNSPVFGGSGGDSFSLPLLQSGIKAISVKGSDRVDKITYGGQTAGGDGGKTEKIFKDTNGDCPASGVALLASDRLDSISFVFRCPVN